MKKLKEFHLNYIVIFCFISLLLQCVTNNNLYGNIKNEDRLLVEQVSKRLLVTLDISQIKDPWPPIFEIQENEGVNAYATFDKTDNIYKVVISSKTLDIIINGNADRLAYILGHELSHIVLGHVKEINSSSNILITAYSRENEKQADIMGMKLALKAGYSFKEAINTLKMFKDKLGDYSSFEALSYDHPPWSKRLSYLDSAQSQLWCSMSSFENGVYFLLFQNYEAAIVCFNKVKSEFPQCYEAYTNIGYAYLMQYFDGFELEDLKYFNDIGQLVVGGFYRRPASLEREIRGIDEGLWWEAIGNFKEALKIKEDLALVKSNLGIAYYLDPRKLSLGESAKYLDEAVRQVENDATLDPILKATVYLNAGVIGMAEEKFEQAKSDFDNANYLINNLESAAYSFTPGEYLIKYDQSLFNAIYFNKIYLNYLENDTYNQNCKIVNNLFEYLQHNNPASIWWEYAYYLYSKIGDEKKCNIKRKEEIFDEMILEFKPVISLGFNNKYLFLSQELNDALKQFDSYEIIPIVEERKINKFIIEDYGIGIITNGEVVLGIELYNNSALVISVFSNRHNRQVLDIQIGKNKDDLNIIDENIPKSCLILPYENERFIFYDEIGLAFLIANNIIKKIIIIQPPIKRFNI